MASLFEYYPEYWIPSLLAFIAIIVFCVKLALDAYHARVTTGREGLLGETGEYRGGGLVQVHGELWKTDETAGLRVGDRVVVRGIDRMTITVEKKD